MQTSLPPSSRNKQNTSLSSLNSQSQPVFLSDNILCTSQWGLLQQKTTDWGATTTQSYFLSSVGKKSKVKVLAELVSPETFLAVSSQDLHSVCRYSWCRLFPWQRQSSCIRIPPSWPRLTSITSLKTLSRYTVTLEVRASKIWVRGMHSLVYNNILLYMQNHSCCSNSLNHN